MARNFVAKAGFPKALRTLSRGLERARAVPGIPDLKHSLKEQITLAQRGQKAAALHELADLIRFRHGINLPSDAEARALITNIRAVWNERDVLLRSGADALDPRSEDLIRADLLELAIASADLRLALAPRAEADAARRDVQQLLDLATAWCGPSPRLDRLRQATTGTPAPTPSAGGQGPAAVSAQDRYDQGRDYLRAGQFREAAQSSSACSTSVRRISGLTFTRDSAPIGWGSFTTRWPPFAPAWRLHPIPRNATTTGHASRRCWAAAKRPCVTIRGPSSSTLP